VKNRCCQCRNGKFKSKKHFKQIPLEDKYQILLGSKNIGVEYNEVFKIKKIPTYGEGCKVVSYGVTFKPLGSCTIWALKMYLN
jgi:hypothetical protein